MSNLTFSDSDTDDEIFEINVKDFEPVVKKKEKDLAFRKIEFNSYKLSKDLKVDINIDSTLFDSTVYNIK